MGGLLRMVAGFLLGAVLSGMAYSQRPALGPREASEKPKTEANADQQQAQNLTGEASTLKAYVVQIETAKDREQAEDERADRKSGLSSSWSTTIFTGASALFAMIQAGFFLWQLRLMREQMEQTRQATMLTRASVAFAEQTSKSQLRAYLGPDKAEIEVIGPHALITIPIANFGSTPAIDVHCKVWLGKAMDEVGASVENRTPNDIHSFGVIEPGHRHGIAVDRPNADSLDVPVAVRVLIEYGNVFGNRYERRILLFLAPKSKGVKSLLNTYKHGNEEHEIPRSRRSTGTSA